MRRIIYSILSLLFVANTMMADDLVTGTFIGPSINNYWTLEVSLINSTNFVAFMMDIKLPEGLTVEKVTPIESRLSQTATATIDDQTVNTPFNVTHNIIKGNTLRVTAYNDANYAISGDSGTPILRLLLKADDEKLYSDMVAQFYNVNFVKATNLAESMVDNTSANANHMDEYLKITALGDGRIFLYQQGTVSATLEYGTAFDGWQDCQYGKFMYLTKGNSLWLRAKGENGKNSTLNSMDNYLTFNSTNSIAASQNIMSLLDASCELDTVPSFAFCNLFLECSSLTTAPELPATKLSSCCYYSMFKGCKSLRSIPDLSHASCSEGFSMECDNMFKGCTSLRMNTMGLGTPWKAPTFEGTNPALHLMYMFQDTGGDMNTVTGTTQSKYPGTPLKDCTYYVLDKPYTREMTNQWGTICLPYAVTITGDEDYDFYTLSAVSGSTLTLKKVIPEDDAASTTLVAGTPVIIRRSTSVNDVNIPASNEDMTFVTTPVIGSSANGLTLTGAFSQTDITNEDGYIIANNAFWNIDDIKGKNKVYCSPFRAWLSGSVTSNAKQLSIGFDDDITTAVEAINAINTGTAEYYDLNGRKLNDLQQGVNIVKFKNGTTKKVIIK